MAQKSVVTKQQDTSRTGASAVQDPRAHLTALADAFNAAVAQCVEDADSDAVHRVRTGSRRLQAMLEAMLRENATFALNHPARLWLRQLKQIRRAAGPVRDLDVHRKLLENLVGKAAAPDSDTNPHHKPAETKQAEMLDDWLKSERKHLARGMQKQIRKRQHGLTERQTAVLNAIGSVPLESVRTGRSADAVALEDFVRAVDAMPLLDAENLHDFRKATKKARYVAESAAEKGPYSSVAKALKRVQDAIGEWHDWQCLLEEAGTALGKDAPDLSAHLEREVERHFAAAMKTTQTMRARLSGEWMALSKPPAKRPVASERLSDRRLASGF
jgi:CHAD domain-containing protein